MLLDCVNTLAVTWQEMTCDPGLLPYNTFYFMELVCQGPCTKTYINMSHQYIWCPLQYNSPHQIRRLQENGPLFLKSWQKLHFCEVPTFSHRSRQTWVGNAATSLWFTWASPGEYRNLLEGTEEKWESWSEKHSVMFSACSPVAVGSSKINEVQKLVMLTTLIHCCRFLLFEIHFFSPGVDFSKLLRPVVLWNAVMLVWHLVC